MISHCEIISGASGLCPEMRVADQFAITRLSRFSAIAEEMCNAKK
jgi:hypothetical protein